MQIDNHQTLRNIFSHDMQRKNMYILQTANQTIVIALKEHVAVAVRIRKTEYVPEGIWGIDFRQLISIHEKGIILRAVDTNESIHSALLDLRSPVTKTYPVSRTELNILLKLANNVTDSSTDCCNASSTRYGLTATNGRIAVRFSQNSIHTHEVLLQLDLLKMLDRSMFDNNSHYYSNVHGSGIQNSYINVFSYRDGNVKMPDVVYPNLDEYFSHVTFNPKVLLEGLLPDDDFYTKNLTFKIGKKRGVITMTDYSGKTEIVSFKKPKSLAIEYKTRTIALTYLVKVLELLIQTSGSNAVTLYLPKEQDIKTLPFQLVSGNARYLVASCEIE